MQEKPGRQPPTGSPASSSTADPDNPGTVTARAVVVTQPQGPAGQTAGKATDSANPGKPGKTKQRKRRDPLWARLAVVFGALIMLGSGGTIVGAKVLIGQYTSNITQTTLIGGGGAGAAEQQGGNNINGVINMLLVGIDQRENDLASGARADTIVILHIPASHDQAYLASIPRDWKVDIPAYPKSGFAGETTKVNAAFEFGYQGGGSELQKRARGVDLLAQTLKRATGITFNGAAIIDFSGFESVVQQLGGVTMCIDQAAQSIHLAINKAGKIRTAWYKENVGIQGLLPGEKPVSYHVGCGQRLSAQLALDYARIRYGLPNTDYDRQRHQQQLLKAIAKEATSKGILTNPIKLNNVLKAAGKAFVLDTQGVPIEDFIFTLKGVAANDLITLKTNNGTYNTEKGTSFEQMSADSMTMLHALRDGTLTDFVLNHPQFIASSG
jgi:LCP family protein required for cell wall assembly